MSEIIGGSPRQAADPKCGLLQDPMGGLSHEERHGWERLVHEAPMVVVRVGNHDALERGIRHDESLNGRHRPLFAFYRDEGRSDVERFPRSFSTSTQLPPISWAPR